VEIGGFQSFSLSEFPGRIAAVVFCRGCNFRCPYCHNPELVDPARYSPPWPEQTVFEQLEARRGKLQGVVITGGEPILQHDLGAFLVKVRSLGYAVKLDTNGSDPEGLQRLISAGLVDHIGLDVKAPPARYPFVTRSDIAPQTIMRSISLVLAAGVDHEFRTTWLPALLSRADLLEIAGMVRGCRSWVVQRFVPSKALDPALLAERPPDEAALAEVREAAARIGVNCLVR
jgi:pyruvate formate lyase activating enzyme